MTTVALLPFVPTNDELLAARGSAPAFARGDRVQVSARCGDGWGEDNLGTVQTVATSPDPKGRYFVGVLMDGQPLMDGRKEHPPLPQFEAGLVRKV